MKSHILEGHGQLCSLYKAHEEDGNKGFKAGDFRSEGDSPVFFHTISTGLRSMEHPAYGGWGGRYINACENTWLDPVPEPDYSYPDGRWYSNTAWGRNYLRHVYPENQSLMNAYFKPITRWADALQNDFAARADWCVRSFDDANHPPVVKLTNALDITTEPGSKIVLSARGTFDPDGDELRYSWWRYYEADSFNGKIKIKNVNSINASLIVPEDINEEATIHISYSLRSKR